MIRVVIASTEAKAIKITGAETDEKVSSTAIVCILETEISDDESLNLGNAIAIFSNRIEMYPEDNPNTNVIVAKAPIPILNDIEDSLACFTSALLGRARNVAPNALTKQARASPLVNTSDPADKMNTHFEAMSKE